MQAFVAQSLKLADAIRDYWELKLAPLYVSRDLRTKERQELDELEAHLRSQNLEAARKIVEKWHQYHDFQGEFADSLMIGVRHGNLAKHCKDLLDLLATQ